MASGGVQETEDSGLPGLSDDKQLASVHGRHTTSEAGGPVVKIKECDFVKRFLILGQPDKTSDGFKKSPTCEKVCTYIEGIIRTGEGKDLVELIKDISTKYRNITHNPVLYCLALCARSDDADTKSGAYRILNEVCRIPSHLFKFIEYYTLFTKERMEENEKKKRKVEIKEDARKKKEVERRQKNSQKNQTRKEENKNAIKLKKMNPHAAYGWGRCFKRAISKWFLSFVSNPEYLAYLLTKYRRRCGWSVKVVIKLAHIKSPDVTENEKAVGLILRYFHSNLKKAQEHYEVESLKNSSIVKRVADLLRNYDLLRSYDLLRRHDNADFIINKLREDKDKGKHRLTLEHISPKALSPKLSKDTYLDVWAHLIPSIPGEGLIRRASLLTRHGLFQIKTGNGDSSERNGDNKERVKIRIESFRERLQEFIPAESGASAKTEESQTKRSIHPVKLLLAFIQYTECSTKPGSRSWISNDDIAKIIYDAFENSVKNTVSLPKKICVAVDVSQSMEKTPAGETCTGEINCLTVAAAMAFTLAKMASSVDIITLDHKNSEMMDSSTDFKEFRNNINKRQGTDGKLEFSKAVDCSEPFRWAQSAEKKDIDAFVVLTVNENVSGRSEAVQALHYYRKYCKKDTVRCVICTMNNSEHTVADPADSRMLDICGCDASLAELIQNFISEA